MANLPRHLGGVPTYDVGFQKPAGCLPAEPVIVETCSEFSDWAKTVDANLITPDLGYTQVPPPGNDPICPCNTARSGTLLWNRDFQDGQLFPTYSVWWEWPPSGEPCDSYVNVRVDCTRNQTTGLVEYFRLSASIDWCEGLSGGCGYWRLDVPPPMDTAIVYTLPFYDTGPPNFSGWCEGTSNGASATLSFSPI